jgi:hypothetical protein
VLLTTQATLYDIGTKLNSDPVAEQKISALSGLAISLSSHPDVLERILELYGFHHVIGHHFFSRVNGINSPIFSLDQLPFKPTITAQVSKINGVDAPTCAHPGLNNEGAIQ